MEQTCLFAGGWQNTPGPGAAAVRSCWIAATGVEARAVLSPVLASASKLVTVAVLTSTPGALGTTSMFLVTGPAPAAIAPKLQVTVPEACVQPESAEEKLDAGGRGSVTVTRVAPAPPLFETDSV